jgi:hypothetical protein
MPNPELIIRDIDLDFKNYKGYNDKVANLFKKVKTKKYEHGTT